MYYIKEIISYYGDNEISNPVAFSFNKEKLEIKCKKLNDTAKENEFILKTQIKPLFENLCSKNRQKFTKKGIVPTKNQEKYLKYDINGDIYGFRDDHTFIYEVKEVKKPFTIFDDFDSGDIS